MAAAGSSGRPSPAAAGRSRCCSLDAPGFPMSNAELPKASPAAAYLGTLHQLQELAISRQGLQQERKEVQPQRPKQALRVIDKMIAEKTTSIMKTYVDLGDHLASALGKLQTFQPR